MCLEGQVKLFSAGLGRDCIPSIQNPKFVTPENATYLSDDDLVYGIVFRGEAIAYPMHYLTKIILPVNCHIDDSNV